MYSSFTRCLLDDGNGQGKGNDYIHLLRKNEHESYEKVCHYKGIGLENKPKFANENYSNLYVVFYVKKNITASMKSLIFYFSNI